MDTAELHRATITVAKIFPAKPGKRSRAIQDVDGVVFDVWPDKLGLINEGATYEVGFTEKRGNSATFRDIKDIREAAPQRPAPRSQPAQAPRAAVRQSAPVADPPRQAPNGNGNGGQYYRPTAPRDARRMFITATLGHFIETGRVECNGQAIANAIGEICAAYDATIALEDQN